MPGEAGGEAPGAVVKVSWVREAVSRERLAVTRPLLVVPGGWCLAAGVDTTGLSGRRGGGYGGRRGGGSGGGRHRRQALLFALEEALPLDAEAIAADFLESGGHALGVAVEAERLEPIVRALEEAGLSPGAIVPSTLLIHAALPAAGEIDIECVADPLTAAPGENPALDLLVRQKDQLRRWRRVAPHARALELAVRQEGVLQGVGVGVGVSGHAALRLRATGVGTDLLEVLRSIPGTVGVEAAGAEEAGPAMEPLLKGIERVSRGQSPPIDLRRGPLAPRDRLQAVRRPLSAAIVALLVAVACGIGGLLYRGHLYEQRAQGERLAIEAVYREAFPGRDVPPAVLSRLRGQAREARGLTGRGGPPGLGGGAAPDRPSAFTTLTSVLMAVPEDLRIRVLEIHVEPDRIDVDGQARSHGDAERLAASLRVIPGWRVDPPSTQTLRDRGVGFTLTATRVSTLPPREEPRR